MTNKERLAAGTLLELLTTVKTQKSEPRKREGQNTGKD
jgi:hypothetical protein